jgi:periplasmic protein TonB
MTLHDPQLPAVRAIAPETVVRHGYARPRGARLGGLTTTGLVFAIILALIFGTLRYVGPAKAPPPPALAMFDAVAESDPAPEPPPLDDRTADAASPEQQISATAPVERAPGPVAAIPGTVPVQVAPSAPSNVQPASVDRVDPVAPPAARAAPPPPASTGSDSWEGRVLAALNKRRRYPPAARARRQQGVPWIRFMIDRQGKVLSAQLERSSGVQALDMEAKALPKRSQPLPAPPAERAGETIELVVPIEFYLE